jgi:hypothetical protein
MSNYVRSKHYLQAVIGERKVVSTNSFELYGIKVGYSGSPNAPTISYDAFVARVCRYRTSDVLRALAGQDRELFGPKPKNENVQVVNAWVAAEIVKVAVLYGSEKPAKADLTAIELVELFQSFAMVHEPEVKDGNEVLRIFTQYMEQQFGWQESVMEELSRTVALFQGDEDPDQKLVRHIIEGSLGVSIEDAVGAVFIVFAAAEMTRGRWAPELLDDARLQEFYALVPQESIRKFVERISADKTEFMERHRRGLEKVAKGRNSSLRRWEFNPMITHPIIKDANGVAVVPVAWAVPRRMTPAMLYYDGMGAEEKKFGGALGKVVEAYVGKQLRLLEKTGARVIPSFLYPGREGEVQSTDWFVDLPDCLLFVEVKSARLSMEERMGDFPEGSGARRTLTKAFEQISRDVQLYKTGHPLFLKHLPNSGKPLVGVVVTLERIHAANFTEFRALMPATDSIQITVTPVRYLERMVLMSAQGLGRELLAIQEDPHRKLLPIHLALPGTESLGQNPILDQAWDEVPVFKWNREQTQYKLDT